MTRVVVVGAGIVGLATAVRLAGRGDEVVVVDKETGVARHQTGRNSGVIHSGLYYRPGSLKARLATAGAASMTAFAQQHGVAVRTCGKLVVAVDDDEVDRLRGLADRATTNGVPARLLSPDEAREIEPHVSCRAALHVTSTGIVDYAGVCAALVDLLRAAGGRLLLGRRLEGARTEGGEVRATLASAEGRETVRADALVSCAGLHADRVARACGVTPSARIVPFRGEYFELTARTAGTVRGLVYPVPDPRFPFLGVHLTTTLDGGVHVGPNAVLALAREGYTWGDVSVRDVADALSWPGLWRLGAAHLAPAAREVARSASRRLFAASVARLVPGIGPDDLVPAPAGVRAQAVARDGSLVDDFLVATAPRQVHVLNAPSPAATASLEIAKHLTRELDGVLAAS